MPVWLTSLGLKIAVVAALVAAIFFYRGEAIRADAARATLAAQNETLTSVNAQNARNVERMLDQAEATNRLLGDLTKQQQDIAADTAAARKTIEEIRGHDAAADEYLRTLIPDGLRAAVNRPARAGR
ncbi:hypothetical protein HDIA_2007 [Hartmannibacter diazotrophicus]|uniref:Phage lysis regulatory protein, LysB family n=1 Tax=Hartmannibacter diazotrophicus TaxID=1482074 RepID=A0A2C9D5X9_9HYPH|nr:hypothetical protein [Hartmannibacter diazotrophicus]SON55548.1 hypothetical protein HDIA_2007 [Hartmannibacter diazotrophicus]